MNSLSWFIYLTQIVDNLGGAASVTLIVMGVFGGVGLAFFTGFRFFDIEDISPQPDHPAVILHKRCVKIFVAVMSIAAVVATFTPSRQTMLMIAGSEMGERLVKSDTANSIVNPGMDLIRKWIKQEADKIKDKT